MFNTIRFNDVQQMLDHLRNSVAQLFSDFSGSSPEDSGEWAFQPAIETGWDDDAFHVRAIVPGVSEKDMKVAVQDGQLIIEGERKSPKNFRESGLRRMAYGKLYTGVTLPAGIDVDKVTCRLHNGVLDVTIPVAEQMKPRQIPIVTDEERKALAA